MNNNNQPHDLPEWLAIATRKLSFSAKQRIRMEIEGHYAEAVEAHKAEGMSEVGSRALALTDLGDGQVANRRFRTRYLVEWEAKYVDSLLNPGRKGWFLVLNYLIFLTLCTPKGFMWASSNDASVKPHLLAAAFALLLQFIFMVVFPTVAFRLRKSQPSARTTSRIVLLESGGGFSIGLLIEYFFQYFIGITNSFKDWFTAVLFAIVFLCSACIGLRILRKLRRA